MVAEQFAQGVDGIDGGEDGACIDGGETFVGAFAALVPVHADVLLRV